MINRGWHFCYLWKREKENTSFRLHVVSRKSYVQNKLKSYSESFNVFLWRVESKLEWFWFFFLSTIDNNYNWLKGLHQLVAQLVSCIFSCWELVIDHDGWKLMLCSLMLHSQERRGQVSWTIYTFSVKITMTFLHTWVQAHHQRSSTWYSCHGSWVVHCPLVGWFCPRLLPG